MAKRRPKKIVKKPASTSPSPAPPHVEEAPEAPELIQQEVERQSAAIRATREVEMERLLTELRLLKSCFSEEQLRAPAIEFLRESFPNLKIVREVESEAGFDVVWKAKGDDLSMNGGGYAGGFRASVLNRFSSAGYPDFSAFQGGFELSSDPEKMSFLDADNLQIRDLGLDDVQIFGIQDGLRTPGLSSQRLSVGMTPKTLRLPKPGEMLLSVRGSPLGVYKEDNMEAIHESEEG